MTDYVTIIISYMIIWGSIDLPASYWPISTFFFTITLCNYLLSAKESLPSLHILSPQTINGFSPVFILLEEL